MLRRRRPHGGKPIKYDYTISDIAVHLNSASSIAVSVDNLSLTWQRGDRSVSSNRARVVEKLDQATGDLSRTAQLLPSELTLPCTLYRVGPSDDTGRWESKASELLLLDADAEGDESAMLCSVPLELSALVGIPGLPTLRKRVELPLGGDLGAMSFSVLIRLKDSGVDDGTSNAGSEMSDVRDLDPALWAPDRSEPRDPATAPSAPLERHPREVAKDAAEARWQEVYQLERSRADALTSEGLQRDVHALIRDKQQLSEENLKLRSTIAAIPLGRRALA